MREVNMFRQAVGEVAQQAAQLESVVAILAWGLAGLDQRVARIVVPNNMERMLSLINELLPLRVQDVGLRTEVQAWVRDTRRLYQTRSAIIHSVWIGSNDEPHWRADLRPFRDKLDYRTTEEIFVLADDMQELSTARASFLAKLPTAAPGPWSVTSTE